MAEKGKSVAHMTDSAAKRVPKISSPASFIAHFLLYFKIHVSTGTVIQTLNTFPLFRGLALHLALFSLHLMYKLNIL